MRFLKEILIGFWRSLLFLGALAGVIYLPSDIQGLGETYPRLVSVVEAVQSQAAWWLLGFAAAYIGWIDARPILRQKLAGKSIFSHLRVNSTSAAHSTQGHDLIPAAIQLSGERHPDGVDLRFTLIIRNRSQKELRVRLKQWNCQIANVSPAIREGVSCSGEMRQSTSQRIPLAKIRLFEVPNSVDGWAMAALAFDDGKGGQREVISFKYQVKDIEIPRTGDSFQIKNIKASIENLEYKLVVDK